MLQSAAQALSYTYSFTNIFCIGMLAILLYATLSDVAHNEHRIHMANVLVSIILYCIGDIFWGFAYYGTKIARTQFSRYTTNVILHILIILVAYCVFRFLISEVEALSTQARKFKSKYFFAPFFLLMILVLISPWTHIIFSIDKDGIFFKGPLFYCMLVFLFGHILYFAINTVRSALRIENEDKKGQYLLITIYTIPIFIGAILRYNYIDAPIFSIACTISVFIIYIFEMRDQISIDILTGVNNRRRGEHFFIKHIQEINSSPHSSFMDLYLFMMDLNKFKSINDLYGHAEGDRALVATADALKKACSYVKSRCIITRFGGDEFVIGAVMSGEEASVLNRKIPEMIEEQNRIMNKPYQISISIGFCYYKREYKTFKGFLNVADKLMYTKKESTKKQQ